MRLNKGIYVPEGHNFEGSQHQTTTTNNSKCTSMINDKVQNFVRDICPSQKFSET